MAIKRVRLIVSGRVQGVFFRAGTRDMAMSLGLNGWVKNLYDGSVEALFQGEENLVDQAVLWCKDGPQGARVDDIRIQTEPVADDLSPFSVRYS